MPHSVEILAFPDCQLLDVTGPLQVFATANDLAQRSARAVPYAPVVVAQTAQVASSSGLVMLTATLPDGLPHPGTLMVAGGAGVNAASQNASLMQWIRSRASVAGRTASVCSGAMLLAQAGLLKGRRAVTHWQRCEEFAQRFPDVKLDADPIYIRDGNLWTSAGVTAGIDLALALVEADLGHAAALAVARHLVVYLKRPGGQAQFSAALALQERSGRFEKLHAWMRENLHQPLALDTLAAQVHMSTRSFCRHYRKAMGQTPARAIASMRLEAACRLLEKGASIAQTATRCGFGSEETLRRTFSRSLGITPQIWRERFGVRSGT